MIPFQERDENEMKMSEKNSLPNSRKNSLPKAKNGTIPSLVANVVKLRHYNVPRDAYNQTTKIFHFRVNVYILSWPCFKCAG